MADFRAKYGQWALVAGASEGLGAEFGRQCAARGLNVLLVARREAKLRETAGEIRAAHPDVEVRTAALDLGALGTPEVRAQLGAATEGLEIGLVVYNAALSIIGPFLEQDEAGLLQIIDVNCRGPVVLAHALGRKMAARGRGGIVLLSSLAGTQGSPLIAVYGATKAFNLVLGEALWDELRERGVDVIACRAGATRTPGYLSSRPDKSSAPEMEPGPVVAETLDRLGRTPSFVPGFANRAAAFFMGRVLGRKSAVSIMGRTMRGMYGGR